MKDKKRSVLFSDYALPQPPAGRREACAAAAVRAARRPARGEGLAAQLKTQLAYVGAPFWLGLAGVLVVLGALLLQLEFESAAAAAAAYETAFYPAAGIETAVAGTQNATLLTLALYGTAGPVLAALAAPVLARSQTHNMWELEEAAYHNLPRLTLLRLMICTLAALPVLVLFAALGFGSTGFLRGAAALAVPFLLANACNYFILGRLRGYAGSLCCVGACLLLALLCFAPLYLPWQLAGVAGTAALWPACAAALGAAGLLFALSARRYIRKITTITR